jgi:hypothetical protein
LLRKLPRVQFPTKEGAIFSWNVLHLHNQPLSRGTSPSRFCWSVNSSPHLSQAGVPWRRPCASQPMFGAPPNPPRAGCRRRAVAELVDLQRTPDEHVHCVMAGVCEKARLERNDPSGPMKKTSAAPPHSQPCRVSPPKQ